jgi:hypothetical protein
MRRTRRETIGIDPRIPTGARLRASGAAATPSARSACTGAGTLVDFFENTLFGNFINPRATAVVDFIAPWPFVHDLLVGQYGIITMARR